jgi:hypothetical protein
MHTKTVEVIIKLAEIIAGIFTALITNKEKDKDKNKGGNKT